jgi:hypothetical protein
MMNKGKQVIVTVENRDPQLPPSENLGSDTLPSSLDSDVELVKYLYRRHKQVLPDKLTVQLTGNFKVVFQAIIKPNKRKDKLESLTGTIFKNKTGYYLGLNEELNEKEDFRIKN